MRITQLAWLVIAAALAGCPATTTKGPTGPTSLRVVTTPGRFERRFDEARQMTLVRVRPPTPPPSGHSLALVAAGGFRGKVPRRYTGVLLGLRSAGSTFQLQQCREVTIFAGERNLGHFGATRETEIGRGWLAEYVLAVVPFTRAYALLNAQEISIVACGQKHQLGEAERGHLRQLVGALRPGAEP